MIARGDHGIYRCVRNLEGNADHFLLGRGDVAVLMLIAVGVRSADDVRITCTLC